MPKIRIIILTQNFPPSIGGIQTVMYNLAFGLSDFFNITVIAPAQLGSREWDLKQSFNIIRYNRIKFLRTYFITSLLNGLSDNDNFFIITDTWKSNEYITSYLKNKSYKLITIAHGNDVLDKGSIKKRIRINNSLSHCYKIIAVSNFTAQLLKKLSLENVKVIPNGINPFQDINPDIGNNITNEGPILLTISRIEPRKGHDKVICALQRLKKKWPNIRYLIAGDGHDKSRLLNLVQKKDLIDNVLFLGFISNKDKAELFRQATIFVMPVRYDENTSSVEGFGITLVEAQLIGCPILTGQTGGVNDIVKDQITGYTCDGNDEDDVYRKIHWMLTHDQEIKRCSVNGQKFAQSHFLMDKMIQSYFDVINNAMSKEIT